MDEIKNPEGQPYIPAKEVYVPLDFVSFMMQSEAAKLWHVYRMLQKVHLGIELLVEIEHEREAK